MKYLHYKQFLKPFCFLAEQPKITKEHYYRAKLTCFAWRQFIVRQAVHSRCTKTRKMHESPGGSSLPVRRFLEKF